MDEHVKTLQRARQIANRTDNLELFDALTAAIEALEPPQDPAELRGLLRRAHDFTDRHLGDSDLEPGADPDQDLATAIAVALDADDSLRATLDARYAAPARMSTEELRDACELAARELWGEEAFVNCVELNRVRKLWTASAGETVGCDDALARVDECASERDALEQLLPVLLVRLVQRGDR